MNIQSGLKYIRTGLVGLAMTVPPKSSRAIAHEVPILKSVELNAKFNEKYMYENPAFIDFLMMRTALACDINTGKFNKSLNIHKKDLMNDLNLTENKFNLYKNALNKIGQEERVINEFGDPGCYDAFDEVINTDKENNTLLMYRFNIKRPSKNEIDLMNKYNIEYPKHDISPEQLAIRSMIHLSELEKHYPKYEAIMKDLAPDTTNCDVKASISNAKRIMENQTLADMAINELDALDMNMSFIDGQTSNPLAGILKMKDLEDLKIYAKTIVLPKEEFLVEMWDRHPIIPVGKSENKACANILHLQLNK